jgi:PAS domain S-box-containing protein/diguanylate cyclase (GGDEF)-like protein
MEIDNASCLTLDYVQLDEVSITNEEYNDILDLQLTILNMIASRGNSADVLARLCSLAEKLLPNSVASVMLLNPATGLMSVLSAPSVPQVGHDALSNLKPGPRGGSCGNAVFQNEPQYVINAFEDSRWEDLREVAIDFNLRSCWSMPIRDEDDKAIGTFALSSFEHRSPAPFHKKLLETAASIVNIVLKNKENEQKIELFSSATQNAVEGIIITDADNNIIEVNKAFTDAYGYTEKEILGKNPKMFSSGRHDESFYLHMWQRIAKESKWSGEIINKNSNGDDVIQWMSVSSIRDERNNANNHLAIFSDLTELKNSQKKIDRMAYHDSITNLKNKVYLETLLKSNAVKTLILLNVNNFSYINSAYGFEVGDKLLIKIADILQNNFQTEATCRINSDEFALLFEDKIDIEEMVSNIKKCFYSQKIEIDTIAINVSFSYGATFGSLNALRNGALALKKAKENGKNNLCVYNQDEEFVNHSKRESFIESNNLLHTAINQDGIVPFFQGIRDNKTNKIIKFEALARILNRGEIISPYRFLEPARLSGLLPEITKVMVDKTFKVMAKNDFAFSINITEDDLSQNYLIDYLEEKSLQYGVKANRVILEILEGVSASGKKNHIKQLTALKQKGYALAIDDFGTEYSNFERVLDLEIDFLKIDAKYVKDIHTNKKSYEITSAIAFFAKNAGIPCVAEFVHCEEVQKIVENLGIEYSQGYYFSQPNEKPIAG